MFENTISTAAAEQFYNRLGIGHDRAEVYEGLAKQQGLAALDLRPGQRVLNVGVGTGKEHLQLQAAVSSAGAAFGLDRSPVMLKLAYSRTGAPLCQADARRLPYASASVDRLFSSYMLDLLAAPDLPGLLAEFRRVLKPGGRMALVSLTEGVDWPSRILVGAWKTAFRLNPLWCGGCRPVQLAALVERASFAPVQREVVTQLGFPSEIIVAER
ncbi:MAG: methyltransferase domain-containing protein [Anaerolineales bacterium]|nr:methyltransferase domain-containing protein [Anaerolineales bacterium]